MRSSAPLCRLHCTFVLFLVIPFILLHCYCSHREPFLLFSHCSLAYFTVCYKYCYLDLSPLSHLATALAYKH
ncbi:hypothetical protein L208DRAFT_549909 [Tricholoma matsutake]|nr:hypothetical protein L208DRAFT_549909 [Tricholoma matsutake 945]